MTADPLRPPDTDDEPWAVLEPEPCDDGRYFYALLAIVCLSLVAVALVRWR